MASRYRAFTDEFLAYMEKRGAWPDHKLIAAWMRNHYGGCKLDFVSDLRNGRYAPEKYATGFIEVLMREADDPAFAQGRLALLAFLEPRGVVSLDLKHLDPVLSHTSLPVLDEMPGFEPSRLRRSDWLTKGVRGIAGIATGYLVRHSVRACTTPEDVECAARWAYVRFGQCRSPEGPTISHPKAIATAERIIGIELPGYARRAAAWRDFNPWTVLFSKRKHKAVGTTIVLPLKPEAYAAVRVGEMQSSDCTPGDMIFPSSHLLIEAVAEDPAVLRTPKANPTRSMLMCLVLQHGALMRHSTQGRPRQYHLLSFDATATNRERMLATGYKATGTTMPRTGFDMWERILDFDSATDLSFLEASFLTMTGRHCPPEPPIE